MKRALFIFFLVFLSLLSGCESEPDIKEQITLPMSFTACTNGSDSPYSVYITRDYCDIEFAGSDMLKGAKLHFEQGNSKSTVGEFSFEIDENSFPAMKALIKAIRTLASNEISGVVTENGVKYTIDETVILVYYDIETEVITGIRTEELGRVFEFTLTDLNPYEAQSNGAS